MADDLEGSPKFERVSVTGVSGELRGEYSYCPITAGPINHTLISKVSYTPLAYSGIATGLEAAVTHNRLLATFSTGRYLYDFSSTITEDSTLDFTKVINDLPVALDVITIQVNFTRYFGDTLPVIDTFSATLETFKDDSGQVTDDSYLHFNKIPNEVPQFADDQFLNFNAVKVDISELSEFVFAETSKPISENFDAGDSTSILIEKSFADFITAIDTFTIRLPIEESETDSSGLTDAAILLNTKVFSENENVSDEEFIEFTKVFNDFVTISDGFSFSSGVTDSYFNTGALYDNQYFINEKVLNEAPPVSESLDKIFVKSLQDSVQAAEDFLRDTISDRDYVNLAGFGDSEYLEITKNISDSISLSDVLGSELQAIRDYTNIGSFGDEEYLEVTKVLAEDPAALDSIASTVVKYLEDFVRGTESISFTDNTTDFYTNESGATDTEYLDITKVLNHTSSLADALSGHVEKFLADSVSASEAFDRTIVGDREYNNAAGFGDDDYITFAKYLADDDLVAIVFEDVYFDTSKSVAESYAASESLSVGTVKSLEDSYFTQDSIASTVVKSIEDFVRGTDNISFTDNTTDFYTNESGFTDTEYFEITKVLSETPSISEDVGKSIFKSFSDIVTSSDVFNHLDTDVDYYTNAGALVDTEYLDITKVAADTTSLAEVLSYNLTAGKLDNTNIAETYSNTILKSLSDFVQGSDSIAVNNFGVEYYTDPGAFADEQYFELYKHLKDDDLSATVAEDLYFETNKIAADAYTIQDAPSKTIEKGFAEAVTFADLFDITTFEIVRNITETILAADVIDVALLSLDKSLADPSYAEDSAVKTFTKDISNTVNVADVFDIADIIVTTFFTDSSEYNDSILFDITKVLLETPNVAELLSNTFDKGTIQDSYTAGETIFLEATKVASDTSSLSDDDFLTVSKILEESTSSSDLIAKTLTKELDDTINVADVLDIASVEVNKTFADSSEYDDSLFFELTKVETDTSNISELASIQPELAKSDTGSLTDSDYFEFIKSIAKSPNDWGVCRETVYFETTKELTNNTNIAELISSTIEKGTIEDAWSVTDTSILTVNPIFNETPSTSSAGSLISQNYVDNNEYFLEDYVGDYRQFA